MNNIVMISVDKLLEHPQNPRKNIGDVTELCESIKKSGILQNLSVVPSEGYSGMYTVVIGHRRLAAAKAAGLEELPCVIKEMTPAEQIATMLAENVQRNELTPLEQAEGIQMMFDLGEKISDVVEKTGLSESTIRRRSRMLEMNIDILRKTEGRGATLADYEKLGQIEDINARNEVLESIGTNNFNMALESVLREQRKKKNREKLFEILDTFAEKSEKYPTMSNYIKSWSCDGEEIKVKIPGDARTAKYIYHDNSYSVTLYKKVEQTDTKSDKKETEAQKKKREAEERERERKAKLEDLAEKAYELRKKFIMEFNPQTKHDKEIRRFLWMMLCFAGGGCEREEIDELCGTGLDDIDTYEETKSASEEYYESNERKAMLISAYLMSGDTGGEYLRWWEGKWNESPKTDMLYECLERLGYQMSDEERKLQNGTHELFEKE